MPPLKIGEGSCVGPFWNDDEVTNALGTEDWVPTQRFEVVQKSKVRGCDSATVNYVNQTTEVTEKLQLPSTDTNVAALRMLRSLARSSVGSWMKERHIAR